MNTAVNINPVSGLSAGAKVAHVFRAHSLNFKRNSSEDERTKHAIIIRNFVHTASDAKGVRELSAKLATYKKRAEEATKEIVKQRNLAKCKELEKEMLERGKKRKGREAELVEASWAITKFPPALALAHDPEVHLKIAKIGEAMVQKYFKIEKEKIGVTAHLDQASMHVHTVFSIPENTTFTALLKGIKYAQIQREFNTLIREEFKDLEIQKITGYKKYETLADYKKSSVSKLEQQLESAKTSVQTYKTLYEKAATSRDFYKERSEKVVEVEKIVEKVVRIEDTIRITELETALKTTNDTLSGVQSALSAKNRNIERLCKIIEDCTEYKKEENEHVFAFFARVVSSLVEKVQDLTKQISALLLSETKKEMQEKEKVAEKENVTNNFKKAFAELQATSTKTDVKI